MLLGVHGVGGWVGDGRFSETFALIVPLALVYFMCRTAAVSQFFCLRLYWEAVGCPLHDPFYSYPGSLYFSTIPFLFHQEEIVFMLTVG